MNGPNAAFSYSVPLVNKNNHDERNVRSYQTYITTLLSDHDDESCVYESARDQPRGRSHLARAVEARARSLQTQYLSPWNSLEQTVNDVPPNAFRSHSANPDRAHNPFGLRSPRSMPSTPSSQQINVEYQLSNASKSPALSMDSLAGWNTPDSRRFGATREYHAALHPYLLHVNVDKMIDIVTFWGSTLTIEDIQASPYYTRVLIPVNPHRTELWRMNIGTFHPLYATPVSPKETPTFTLHAVHPIPMRHLSQMSNDQLQYLATFLHDEQYERQQRWLWGGWNQDGKFLVRVAETHRRIAHLYRQRVDNIISGLPVWDTGLREVEDIWVASSKTVEAVKSSFQIITSNQGRFSAASSYPQALHRGRYLFAM
ncbi:hypothetical protein N0V90_008917 [Kalmusia sp. IMI 367209]|nr:hypothetical protein N0V90_008917 [Kalmusia sp. IMI 367209]